jgi:hypothetical protein
MKILIQFPTLNRPAKFIKVLKQYVESASSWNEIFFNINCDALDSSMKDSVIVDNIYELLSKKPNILGKINYDENTTKISAINSHIDEHEFDIVICASDDMVPKVHGWDQEIVVAMNKHFPNMDGCVHFNDGNTKGNLITFSILGKELYKHFGYIYHPDYKSLYCDDEFTSEVTRMKKVAYVDKVIISHEHWSLQGSENHNQIDYAVKKTLHYSGRDKFVFDKRKELGFPKHRITED